MRNKLNLGKKKCLQCGKEIQLKIRRDITRKTFCSRKCSTKYSNPSQYVKYDALWRQKLRKPHKITDKLLKAAKNRGDKLRGIKRNGKYIDCKYCGDTFYIQASRINGIIGKNGYIQNRRYCSNKCRYLSTRKPDESKTDKVRLKEWSIKILQRDNHKCIACGCKRKRLLIAHHIKEKWEYPELAYNIDNGKTLCVYCHTKYHKKYLTKFILSAIHLKSLKEPYESTI